MAEPAPRLRDSHLDVAGRVATLTLDRDDVRNALTGTGLATEIAAVADWINRAPEVSVLVLTGAGGAFSAGGNVHDMAARADSFAGDAYALQEGYRLGIQRMTLAMHGLEVPALAAINGAAIGAGFDLACMCDLRFAAAGAKLGETFVNLGLVPGDGGSWFLQRLVGYQRAAELTFSGRRFDAEEGAALGIVLEVLPAADLGGRVAAVAAELAAKPPQALRLTKRLLRFAQDRELGPTLDLSAALQAACHQTADHQEAVSAFLERRDPRFTGS
jgi:enoyl-CoA hydratase/carnithine racemase